MHRKLFKWSLSIISYLRLVSRTWCFVFKNERFISEDDIVVVQIENCSVNLKKHDMNVAVTSTHDRNSTRDEHQYSI
jgi:hypothetical protein